MIENQKGELVPLCISFGGGVNSTAMIAIAIKEQIQPEFVIFADTGGEKPETYAHFEYIKPIIQREFGIEMVRVQTQDKSGEFFTLEEWCLKDKALPSKAYGFSSCSDKHKIRPANKYLNSHPLIKEYKKLGMKHVRWIGYDYGESKRIQKSVEEYDHYFSQYPLVERRIDRQGCIDVIKSMGWEVPVKSACFYCPSAQKWEVLQLKKEHPDLYKRACDMEDNAELTSVKGLGRAYNWKKLGEWDDRQPGLMKSKERREDDLEDSPGIEVIPPGCGCHD